MRIETVVDIPADEIGGRHYDLQLFASGSEARSLFVAEAVRAKDAGDAVVLGFPTRLELDGRKRNDERFQKLIGREVTVSDASDDAIVLQALETHLGHLHGEVRLLVDYSVMVRTWYAAVLNWARYACPAERINIDFLYSGGRYPRTYPPRVISGIRCIPGCEGHPDPISPSVAIFGLGFDGSASMTILDYLEPDCVFAFGAESGEDPGANRAKMAHEELLQHLKAPVTLFPLMSVQTTYVGLSEVISPFRGEWNVVIIPLGPKPHVLASIVNSIRYEDVSCLHVSGDPPCPPEVLPTGELSAARVEFVRS